MTHEFIDDKLHLEAFCASIRPLLLDLLGVRVETRCERLGAPHLLVAIGRTLAERLDRVLGPSMAHGQSAADLVEGLREYYADPEAPPVRPGALTRQCFTPEGLDLLAALGSRFPGGRRRGDPVAELEEVVRLVCRHMTEQEKNLLSGFLDVEAVASGAGGPGPGKAAEAGTPSAPAFLADGSPNAEVVTEAGAELLRAALRFAKLAGHRQCQMSHLALACFDNRNPIVQKALRVYGRGARLRQAHDVLFERLRGEFRGADLPLARSSFSKSFLLMLDAARRPIGPGALLLALLRSAELDPLANDELRNGPLRLDVDGAIAFIRRSLERDGSLETAAPSTELPAALARHENLTLALAETRPSRYIARPECEDVERALHAHGVRCVVVHGEPGVGCSAVVESVAQRAALGQIPFLKDAVFARMDAGAVDEKARAATLNSILLSARRERRIILVIESFQCFLEVAASQLRRLSAEPGGLVLLGVLPSADHRRLLAPGAEAASHLRSVEVAEAKQDLTVQVLEALAPELETEYGVAIRREDLLAVVRMADEYLGVLRRPGRASQLLRWACDEASFAVEGGASDAAEVDRAVAARALARRISVDVDQILGLRGAEYYIRELSKNVVGQPEAVELAAKHIGLTRKGARASERPAGILFFAGQTGTGKTLLAEEIARVYSPKGTVRTFPMGEFQEKHSVARFVGAPPGYVGYQEGGGLVDALLADPSSVLLFDEAEKAHAQVWDALLQLLGKGWIEDAARRVARASKVFIVFTSNLCQEVIDACLARGLSYEETAKRTVARLRDARHPQTGELRFRPEFFARLHAVVVFRPLGPEELKQIALIEIRKQVEAFRDKRSILLESAADSWDDLAVLLTEISRDDPKHGRAIEQAFSNHVAFPLANAALPRDVSVVVRVEVKDDRVNLYGPDGARLTEGSGRVSL